MAKVKQKVSKGVIGLLVIALFCFVLGAFSLWSRFDTNHKAYTGVHDKSNNGRTLTVSIIWARELGVEDNARQYLTLTENERFVIVELAEDDKTFESLERDNEEYFLEPYQFVAEQTYFDDESQQSIKKFGTQQEISDHLDYQTLLSVPTYHNSQLFSLVVSLVAFAGGIALVVMSYIKYGKNKNAYGALFDVYPELERDFSLIETQSAYYDARLAISVYKNHVLFMKYGFNCFELDQVEWMGHQVNTLYVNGIPSRQYFINVLVNQEESQSKPQAISQGKYQKKMEADIQAFFNFIAENYPHIKLGEQEKPEQAKNNGKVTINEFLAQKEAKNSHDHVNHDEEQGEESSQELE